MCGLFRFQIIRLIRVGKRAVYGNSLEIILHKNQNALYLNALILNPRFWHQAMSLHVIIFQAMPLSNWHCMTLFSERISKSVNWKYDTG